MKAKTSLQTLSSRSLKRLVRSCVVCGARVRNQNLKTTTCDTTCTKAKKKGISRTDQIADEMNEQHAKDYCDGCGFLYAQCQCWDAINGTD